MDSYKNYGAFILLLFCTYSYGQSAIIPAGGNSSSTAGSISYSTGQLRVEQANDLSFSSSEGVQQAYELSIETGYSHPDIPVLVTVYPNPTSAYLLVETPMDKIEELKYQIININGVIVLSGNIDKPICSIQISSYPEGSYLLKLYTPKQIIASFNISKIQ